MITDAIWDDFNNDGATDLIVIGEWMAPKFFKNENGKFIEEQVINGELNGLWQSITAFDIDNDGDIDILITNRVESNEICLNDGNGDFSEIILFGNAEDATIDVEVYDMNQDGFKDLILANRNNQPNYIYLNDGGLNFNKKIR